MTTITNDIPRWRSSLIEPCSLGGYELLKLLDRFANPEFVSDVEVYVQSTDGAFRPVTRVEHRFDSTGNDLYLARSKDNQIVARLKEGLCSDQLANVIAVVR